MPPPKPRVRNLSDLWYYTKKHSRLLTIDRGTDPELRQLQSLRRTYGKTSSKTPDVLMFGDSAMVTTTSLDRARTSLSEMIVKDLSPDLKVQTIGGPAYFARLVSAFLTELDESRSKPRAVVVPTSVLMAQRLWAENPRQSYIQESAALREIIASGGPIPSKGLPRSSKSDYENYDRLPAPSLIGARRTTGELRLFLNSVPQTPWQTAVRLRAMLDYYNAEKLEPTSPGVVLVSELGAQLAKIGVPSIAYIPPINYEIVRTLLGETALEHITRNADVIARAFTDSTGGLGQVVNEIFDHPSADFVDPVHLTYEGRKRFAGHVSDAIRSALASAGPKNT